VNETSGAPNRLIGAATPLLLLLAWELAGDFGIIDVRFFPPPSRIAHQIGVLCLRRTRLKHAREPPAPCDPLVSATYPIPKSAILPLVLLIFSLGEMSKVVMVALGAFYPTLINTALGVVNLDRIYLDVGHNFRAGKWQVFGTMALLGALPSIMAGVKLAARMGLILIAISEMVAANDGIGFMIWNAWQELTVDTMYVGLLVIAVLGFIFSVVLDEIERRLIPWKSNA
jgi:ABC-type nitrate/sulfonate/bicarbonate transport system permease component